ncbi:hypothetical protein [Oceanospirillum sp.]|uniref:hypothetical protein n=1 Tax=Oceanospirillum sp. TaxID=2021254 RepID=UPI003A904DCB
MSTVMTFFTELKQISRKALLLLLIAGGVIGYALAPDEGFGVRFENRSAQMITAIKLDFGSADGQSSLQTFRLASGESRTLFLNHPSGAGFNVQVFYADGQKREFCALKGNKDLRPTLVLQP